MALFDIGIKGKEFIKNKTKPKNKKEEEELKELSPPALNFKAQTEGQADDQIQNNVDLSHLIGNNKEEEEELVEISPPALNFKVQTEDQAVDQIKYNEDLSHLIDDMYDSCSDSDANSITSIASNDECNLNMEQNNEQMLGNSMILEEQSSSEKSSTRKKLSAFSNKMFRFKSSRNLTKNPNIATSKEESKKNATQTDLDVTTKEESKKNATQTDLVLRYQPISFEESSEKRISAYNAGWGPAFAILHSMNFKDRETIAQILLVKRKTDFYNEYIDSHQIIFKSVFGFQSRTSTALRTVRLLKKATWAHALLKATTALNMSVKMLYTTGDWRLPTRVTDKMTRNEAHLSCTEEFDVRNSLLMDKLEHKFYKKTQRIMHKRLGDDEIGDFIADYIIEQAGPDKREIFTKFLEAREKHRRKKQKKKEKKGKTLVCVEKEEVSGSDKTIETEYVTDINSECSSKSEKHENNDDVYDQENNQTEENANGDNGPLTKSQFEILKGFPIRSLIENIEKAKPGFGIHVILLVKYLILKLDAESENQNFQFTNDKEMIKKLAAMGAKDGIIGLSIGIPLATFVNPFLGIPLMAMSFINLTLGSTELNLIEAVSIMMMHVLILSSNGTSIQDF